MEKQFVLPGAIVCVARTSFQAGCKGQHVGDIMSQLVPGGSQENMCWSCALLVLTGDRTDLTGSWNVLGPFLSGLSKQMSASGVSSSCKTPPPPGHRKPLSSNAQDSYSARFLSSPR